MSHDLAGKGHHVDDGYTGVRRLHGSNISVLEQEFHFPFEKVIHIRHYSGHGTSG